MEDSLIPKFGKYYDWCCPNCDNSMVESIFDYEQPCTEGRPKKTTHGERK